jgi:membrane-associated phospholipid phosphatase
MQEIGSTVTPASRRTTFQVLAVAAGTMFLLFAGLAVAAATGSLAAFNSSYLLWVHLFEQTAFDSVAVAVTNSGSVAAVMAYGALFAFWLVWRKQWLDLVPLGVAFLATPATTEATKLLMRELRPQLFKPFLTLTSYSFPSGHTSGAFAVFGYVLARAIANQFRPRWQGPLVALLALWAICVGMSRVYLGVHWPGDVLAGACLGLGWAFLGAAVRCKLETSAQH